MRLLGRTDRYILGQLMVLFGFFSLVLVSIYWINRAVILFDTLIGSGHSSLVFLEFSILSLPNVIRMALPLAEFAAAAYVCNRLITDSEMVVLQTTGCSPWRLARPFVWFGVIVALMMSLLTHYLVPKSSAQLQIRTQEISQSVTAKLLTDGTFLHPSKGITFYIREITPEGVLQDVFLSDNRKEDARLSFTASEAYLVRENEGTKLVMVDGMAQSLTQDGRLSVTNFRDLTYDVGNLIGGLNGLRPHIYYLPTAELLFEANLAQTKTGSSLGRIAEQAHGRFAQALLCLVIAVVACSTLIQGSFSRFGPGRFIVLALFILIFVKIIESAVADPVRADPANWWMMYLAPLAGLTIYVIQQLNTAGSFPSIRRQRAQT